MIEPSLSSTILACDAIVSARCEVPFVVEVPTSLKTSFKDVVQPLASTRWRGGD
jgi:hypothetical protein